MVSVITTKVDEVISVEVPRKRRTLRDRYQQLKLRLGDSRALTFRAYDEAVAYRWETELPGSITVESEQATFAFAEDAEVWFPRATSVVTPQEALYERIKLSDIGSDDFASTGVLVALEDGVKLYVSEADLRDYPGMFLRGDNDESRALVGKFARRFVDHPGVGPDLPGPARKRVNELARTDGNRTFPWRFILVTEDDRELIDTEIVYKLSSPCEIDDPSWVRPGKAAWEWWHALNLRGVDFESGINTNTYLHYIDFAAEHGIEYVLLDYGWSAEDSVLEVNPNLDMEAILRRGREQGVEILLWAAWRTLSAELVAAFDLFESWGVAGVKIDYMNRDEQQMVRFYERVAEEAAKRRLLVNFHGSYKPTGIRRRFPNVITREGVRGLEYSKGGETVTPEHDVTIPFTRMVAGPMDYTPGAMRNGTKDNFRSIPDQPMSQGTRCHQLAMFVVYESPLQMLCDSPSNYREEQECLAFMSMVPTVWDETKVIAGSVGDYVAIARRSGEEWFVGAMTDGDPRTVEAAFDFLPAGTYRLRQWADGVNAHRHAEDYLVSEQKVDRSSTMAVRMAPGGGWAAHLVREATADTP